MRPPTSSLARARGSGGGGGSCMCACAAHAAGSPTHACTPASGPGADHQLAVAKSSSSSPSSFPTVRTGATMSSVRASPAGRLIALLSVLMTSVAAAPSFCIARALSMNGHTPRVTVASASAPSSAPSAARAERAPAGSGSACVFCSGLPQPFSGLAIATYLGEIPQILRRF